MYNIEDVAADLGLQPVELQEIYDDFFLEAVLLLQGWENKLAVSDFHEMRQTMHALKGMAANLRMEQLVQLARQAERDIIGQNSAALSDLLEEVRRNIEELREQVNAFYPGT